MTEQNTVNVGANVGDLIEGAVSEAGTCVQADTQDMAKHNVDQIVRTELVGCVTNGVPEGRLGVDATFAAVGSIVIAERGKSTNQAKAYAWELIPFGFNRKTGHIFRGAIKLTRMVRFDCPSCGNKGMLPYGMMMDERRRLGSDALPCSKCNTAMNRRNMYNKLFPDGNDMCKAAFNSADAADYKLLSSYHDGENCGGRNADVILPRIWCVYPMGKTPSNWVPDDPVADALVKQMANREKPASVLPFELGYALRSRYLGAIVMTCSSQMRCGWLTRGELGGDGLNYRRNLAPMIRTRQPFEV